MIITYDNLSVTAIQALAPPVKARKASIVAEGDSARFTLDPLSLPDGTAGIPLAGGGAVDLDNDTEINNFRIISTGTTVLHIHYYSGPYNE